MKTSITLVWLSWIVALLVAVDAGVRLCWPVDVPEAKGDLDGLYQGTISSFAFTK